MTRKILLILALFCFTISLYAQHIEEDNFELGLGGGRAGVPSFELAAYSAAGLLPGETELTVELLFANEDLQFIKTKDGGFRADFQVSLTLSNADGKEEVKKMWSGNIRVEEFDQTNNSIRNNRTSKTVVVNPGKYAFRIELIDYESRTGGFARGTLQVRAFSAHGLQVSDVREVAADAPEDIRKIRFEIYNVPVGDSISISFESSISENEQTQWKIASDSDSMPVTLSLNAGSEPLPAFTVRLSALDTTVVLVSQPQLSKDEISVENIDDAIWQMVHIAGKSEMKRLRAASGQEKIRLFKEFWLKHDPTPGTPDNEHMQEYYRRVQYANEKFTSYREGWLSDMGEVYIKLGPPDIVRKLQARVGYSDSMSFAWPPLLWQYMGLEHDALFVYESGEYKLENFVQITTLMNDGVRF